MKRDQKDARRRAKARRVKRGSKPAGGLITSLHVIDPKAFARVKKAASVKGESVSKFMLRASDKEASAVLEGNCPTCGKKLKAPTKAAA